MAEIVWVHISNGHSKVWGFDCFTQANDETEVITYWGRIGLTMDKLQKNRKQFTHFGDAHDYVRNKVDEKQFKGYKRMPNHQYFGLIHQDAPLSLIYATIENLKEDSQ